MQMKKISVIIPTYNRAQLIERALQSVLDQEYPDLEVIVVDDCSTDNTEDVVNSINDPRIKFIKHTHNKGANAARNTGIRAASGKYIAFQDSDDEWMPGKLAKQVDAFEGAPEDIGVVYTAFWRIEKGEKTYTPAKDVLTTDGYLLKELLKRNFITTQSILVKKECLEAVGLFDESMPRLQDWELLLRIAEHYRFHFIDEALVNLYHTSDSITSDQKALTKALLLLLEKHYSAFARYPAILANFYCYLGQQFFLSDDMSKSLHYCANALKIRPLNPKFWLVMMTFALGKDLYSKVKVLVLKCAKLLTSQKRG